MVVGRVRPASAGSLCANSTIREKGAGATAHRLGTMPSRNHDVMCDRSPKC
jgi:hypothetical protein